jgi:hypothetical protein
MLGATWDIQESFWVQPGTSKNLFLGQHETSKNQFGENLGPPRIMLDTTSAHLNTLMNTNVKTPVNTLMETKNAVQLNPYSLIWVQLESN